jgi:hypothetical protein
LCGTTTPFITAIIILTASAVSSQTGGSGDSAGSRSGVATAVKAVKRTQDPARRREGAQARIDAAIAIVNRFESEAKARGSQRSPMQSAMLPTIRA